MKRYVNPKGTITFIAIAVMLMVIVHFLFKDTFQKPVPVEPQKISAIEVIDKSPVPIVLSEEEWVSIEEAFEEPYVEYEASVIPEPAPKEAVVEEPEVTVKAEPEKILPKKTSKPLKKTIEPYVLPDGSKPKIAIIIDDMGMNRKNGFKLIDMDVPLTLAFLPYAPSLEDITDAAQERGHELMIHMPMEPLDSKQNLGGIALRDEMTAEDLEEQLAKAFESFDGYKGLNNHMGSRITQNSAAMKVVMENLRKQDLYFVDSVTIGSSVAGQTAWNAGLRTAVRDVFLDHEDSIDFVRKALRKTENAAKRKGFAIAIGHPKNSTIQGLREWLPTLEAKGFEIVPASALVKSDNAAKILAQKEVPLSSLSEQTSKMPLQEPAQLPE